MVKAFADCNRLERATKVNSQPVYILLVENNRKDAELLQESLVEVGINQWRVVPSRCD